MTAKNSLRFASSWRKRKCVEIKDDSKIKRQKNIDPRGPISISRMYATFPTILGSHYRLPLSFYKFNKKIWGELAVLGGVEFIK
jgi:hypothetical protein